MAKTDFASMTTHDKKVWSLDFWKVARNASFINQFAAKGENAMVQKVTELTKTERGDQAVITLVADMTGDGIGGDNDLEGNEEALKAYDDIIVIDQLRGANRTTGQLADQKSIVRFREQSRDKLAYWMADRIDQMAFLTLSGKNYNLTNRGGDRSDAANAGDTTLENMAFNTHTDATDERNFIITGGTVATAASGADTTDITIDDTISYSALVRAKAMAKERYIRGVKQQNGDDLYHVFVTPTCMAALKLEEDFKLAVRHSGVRSNTGNPAFGGFSSVMVDGMMIHEFRHVFTTEQAGDGQHYGSSGTVPGCRALMCGAQAMGMVDLETPRWFEKEFDYNNQKGISVAKMLGFSKPKFHSNYTGDVQDFGVVAIDCALGIPQ